MDDTNKQNESHVLHTDLEVIGSNEYQILVLFFVYVTK